MTSGPILRHLVLFALPLMLGNVFQMLYNTVDSIIVGNFVSKQALAAVGSTTPIVNMMVFFFNGFSVGAAVVIGRSFGARDMKKLHTAVQTTMAATFVISLLFTVLGVAAVRPLLHLMNTPADVFEDAVLYLRIYIGGISGLLVYNMGSGVLRAVGDSTRPLYFLILGMGVAGVAVATILSQFISAALVLLLLTRTRDIYRLQWRELRIDFPTLRRIFSVGMPAALQSILTAFSNVFVQGYINFFGSDVMAGWGSYNKLDQFILLPMQSVAMAATTFVSQNSGAGDEKRSHQGTVTAIAMTCTVMGLIAAALFIWAPGAVRLFSPDADVIRYGVMFIRTNVFFLLFNCVNHVLAGSLRGRGDARGPMIIMLTSFVAIRQCYLYLVTHFVANTPRLVGFGYPVGWFSCCVLLSLYAWRKNRRRMTPKQLRKEAETLRAEASEIPAEEE